MNYDENYEVEIDLKKLIFYVFYRWRSIIVVAVAAALLLGGVKVVKGLAAQGDSELVAESQEEYEKAQKLYDRTKANYEREIENLEKSIEDQEAYLANSVLLNISAYEKPEASANILIQMDESAWAGIPESATIDPTDAVVNAYTASVWRGIDWKELEDEFGISQVYLKELVSVSSDYNSNAVYISACHEDEKQAEKMLDVLIDRMESKHSEIAEVAGEHTFTVVNKTSGIVTDLGLADKQKQNSDRSTNYQKQLSEKEKALDELKEPEVPTALSKREIAKDGIKYAVIGGVLGAFALAFVYCVLYVMNPRLRSEEEMKRPFGCRVLGVFALPEKKGVLAGIDRWLERLAGDAERPSAESVVARAAVNLKNYAGEARTILVTGTVAEEQLQRLSEQLSRQMSGIQLVVGADINRSTETLEKAAACDAVVLVEERWKSKNQDILQEKETLEALKKYVIGCIVL